MHRARIAAARIGGALAISALALGLALVMVPAAQAGASGISVKVSPTSGLKSGQLVKVSGTGLPTTTKGKKNAWFADECTSAVTGKLSPADEKHCDIGLAKALKVSAKGAFSATFKVATGKVGDGTCSSKAPCVIGVGDAGGAGAVVKIKFG
jgi:hypothetical protein